MRGRVRYVTVSHAVTPRLLVALALLGCSSSDGGAADASPIDSATDATPIDSATAMDVAPAPDTPEPYCPSQLPMPGTACEPAARVCLFWPRAMDARCDACTCTDGRWSCSTPTTCAIERAECKPGTACTTNTGCGAGRCNYFCACGDDNKLHCSANPC